MRVDTRTTARNVGNRARGAASSRWMTLLARFGYAIKGVVYLIIGILAALLAAGHGGAATDQRGVLRTIYEQPFGQFLLVIMIIGLIGFALWSFIQAIFDTEAKGRKAKGIIARVGYAAVGVSYALLAFGAYQLLMGKSSATNSTTSSTQFWTAEFLKQPFGVPLVIIGGLIIIGVALYLFSKAYTAKFQRRLSLGGLQASMRKLMIGLGRFGYAAIGVVMAIVGIFLIVAALQNNPDKAQGLDKALQTLLHQPFGPLLLGIVALGFIAYGAYSFVEARYRIVGRV